MRHEFDYWKHCRYHHDHCCHRLVLAEEALIHEGAVLRDYSLLDQCIMQLQDAVTTLCADTVIPDRVSPDHDLPETQLTSSELSVSRGLMRINHTGEVCAQALYRGQACAAKEENVLAFLKHAEIEENDHLIWCHDRLKALGAQRSLFNVYWYAHSFCLGMLAGWMGDDWSLGFVAETEAQVADHLQNHQQRLSPKDERSHAIVAQMLVDEQEHGDKATELGARVLPVWIKSLMRWHAHIMKAVVYYV